MVNIYLTRHAFSCANLQKEIGMYSLLKSRFKKDPSITLWGMIGTIKKSNDYSKGKITVYVSCLTRTWMTAILLYNYSHIHLMVSPYAKEQDFIVFNDDNFPLNFKDQCKKLMEFLDYVYANEMIKKRRVMVEIYGTGIVFDTENPIYSSFDYERKRVNFEPKIKGLPNIPISSTKDLDKIKVDTAEYTEEANISIHPLDFMESDSQLFVSWLLTQPTSIKDEYHCILHSNIISNYIEETFGIKKKDNPFRKQNTWTLKLNVNKSHIITSFSLQGGVPQPKLIGNYSEPICK